MTAITRKKEGASRLGEAGVEAVVCNVFDEPRLRKVVAAAEPEVVIHQLTALPPRIDPRQVSIVVVVRRSQSDEVLQAVQIDAEMTKTGGPR